VDEEVLRLREQIQQLEEERAFLRSELREPPIENYRGVHLSRQESLIVMALRPRKIVRYSSLVSAVTSQTPETVFDGGHLKIRISRLRKKLGPVGMTIACHRHQGYEDMSGNGQRVQICSWDNVRAQLDCARVQGGRLSVKPD
jgi:hypothetical protein